MRRWLTILAVSVSLLGALTLLWFLVLSPRVRGEIFRARVQAKLESADPAVRRDAAESIAGRADPFLVTRIAQALYGEEHDPGVAAAFVRALGEIGDPQQLPAVRFATEPHQPGEVRAAAWVALARIDRGEFDRQVSALAEGDAWSSLGIAHARLSLGDPYGVETLLRAAESEDPAQAAIACDALNRHLRPILVGIGQWPLRTPPSEAWPRRLTPAVAKRVAGIDLDPLFRGAERAKGAVEPILSTLKRILNARNRIENWLTDPNNHRWIP
ncbi:MAG: HEAT repeat domain-containing protein [Phycisphaerales bacterium]|nr:HEAT repeat domain-containing protein [Phycisphaerales bacterium]